MTNLLVTANKTFKKVGFKVKKNSPELLIGAGIVGVIASTVMACKATTKLNDILKDSEEQVQQIHDATQNVKLAGRYSEEDAKKDLLIVYTQTGLKVVKLYAPAVLVGGLSLASILTSHKILKGLNVALAAAYTAVDKGFKEYRNRVIERFGEAVDKELKYNVKAQEIEKTVVDEKGKEKKVKETVNISNYDPEKYSEYAKFFDCGNPNWEKDAEYNLMFLRNQEKYANDKLQANGYLFLNEVYDMLGIPRTKAGQVVGWTYDEKNPIGDNYVSFGIYDINKPANRDFVNGVERTILLDFNVDGNIWEMM